MSLRTYQKKRDFKVTAEPSGKRGKKPSKSGLIFVVQKHAASHLHYDFRLELDGVLLSWAVPKGPSMDPRDKRLAVHVEDHPLDYASFEGTIPKGQYGGGTVMVWDIGTWEPLGDPRADMRQGKLKFRLDGKRLVGNWALVQMKNSKEGDGKNWLLMKEQDSFAKKASRATKADDDRSAVSDRTMDEIAGGKKVWQSNRPAKGTKKKKKTRPTRVSRRMPVVENAVSVRKVRSLNIANVPGAVVARQPSFIKPQLATLVDEAPSGEQWVHEIKFDGYRMLGVKRGSSVQLMTRTEKDWTHRFPTVADAVRDLPVEDAIVDGEVVALEADGSSSFQSLQNALRSENPKQLHYVLFDLPFCDGYDLRGASLLERKAVLEKLMGDRKPGILQYSEHAAGSGKQVLDKVCRLNLEGIISKRADAPYVSVRTRDWLKSKCLQRQEFVIGGYSAPGGSRVGFGALLLGVYEKNKFVYCGRVGTGFDDKALRQMRGRLQKLAQASPPFANPPVGAEARDVTWVRPQLVGEVKFREWTDDGLLRQPAFEGLREDKNPREVRREIPADVQDVIETSEPPMKKKKKTIAKARTNASSNGDVRVAGIVITHPERVIYPEQGVTKLDIAQYYEKVSKWILPYVTERPISFIRCPKGQGGECFFQRHVSESLPSSIHGIRVPDKGKAEEYAYIEDLNGLIAMAQFGALEFHPWGCRVDDVDKPDQIVFDLDPDAAVDWPIIPEACLELRDLLKQLGLKSFAKLSGGKGVHVVVPIQRRNTWEEVKTFSHNIAVHLAQTDPQRYIATASKAKRRGRIFVDYLRNSRGATSIAAYSTRARAGAPVAMPISWEELSKVTSGAAYTVESALPYLARRKTDPWKGFRQTPQYITREMMKAAASL